MSEKYVIGTEFEESNVYIPAEFSYKCCLTKIIGCNIRI